jgi:hypothetical protein
MTLRILLTIAVAGVISISATPRASAADITLGPCVNETGHPSDVLAGGTLFAAVTAGKSATVNKVKFAAESPSSNEGLITFGSAPIMVHGIQTPYESYGAPPATWDASYRALVSGGAYSEYPSGTTAIQITGLTAGHEYVVQIFEAFWNTNFATVFTGGQSSSCAVNLSGAAATGSAASGTAQYVVGTFVADSDTEPISLSTTTGYVIFDAMQVRDMGVPGVSDPGAN